MNPLSLVAALVLAALLAGCTSTPTVNVGEGRPRCDRNGDEDQRRAC